MTDYEKIAYYDGVIIFASVCIGFALGVFAGMVLL